MYVQIDGRTVWQPPARVPCRGCGQTPNFYYWSKPITTDGPVIGCPRCGFSQPASFAPTESHTMEGLMQ